MEKVDKYVIGNWKMHGDAAMASSLVRDVAKQSESIADGVWVVVCPPAVYMEKVKKATEGSKIRMGGQDCHMQPEGAFTGNISANMLADMGCNYVIVGHSERWQYHHETSDMVRQKAEAAMVAGLIPVICVGETLEERESGKAQEVVARQLAESVPADISSTVASHFLLAYEPVWAIGSGKIPSADDIARMHGHILQRAGDVPVLYGGSVKAANAGDILSVNGVSGVLVGGASLKAEEFCGIIAAACEL